MGNLEDLKDWGRNSSYNRHNGNVTRNGMTTFSVKLGREISKHHEDKGIMSNEQDEFITNKSCLTKLIVV